LQLDAIKRAIDRGVTVVETGINKPKAAEEEERARRDLDAQEGMAFWAKWMFWAATGEAALTFIGVILVGWTLYHTKRAADFAADAVDEGRKATAAAVAANVEAKRHADLAEESFKRLERPYIYIFGVRKFEGSPKSPARVEYCVANYGKTPANISTVATGISFFHQPLATLPVDYRDDPEHDLLVRPVLPPGDVRNHLFVDAPGNLQFTPGQSASGELIDVFPKPDRNEHAFVWIQVFYNGPFADQEYEISACWRYDTLTKRLVPWGGPDHNYAK
jgi:hypothetical protein